MTEELRTERTSAKTSTYAFYPKTFEDQRYVFAVSVMLEVPKGVITRGGTEPMILVMDLTEHQFDLFRRTLKALETCFYCDTRQDVDYSGKSVELR